MRRTLTPRSRLLTMTVALVASLLPIGGALAIHAAKAAADSAASVRPAALGDPAFYESLFGLSPGGKLQLTNPSGSAVMPELPADVRAFLERSAPPAKPVKPSQPAEPAHLPDVAVHPTGVATFTAPIPVLSTKGIGGLTCTEMVRRINGITSRCVSPNSPEMRAAAKGSTVPGGVIWGFTKNQSGEVQVSTVVPRRYLLTVMLHERGHQLVQLKCLGPVCSNALIEASGNTGDSLDSGPYFTRPHEVAAETYAACHGGIPDSRYRLMSCSELERVLALYAVDKKAYDAELEQNRNAMLENARRDTEYQEDMRAYNTAMLDYDAASKTQPLELQLWQQVHRFDSSEAR
jgi:hypothetical protein